MQESKTCTKCRQIKSLDSFSKHNGKKSAKNGYRATCKSCQVAYNKDYRSRNREKVNRAKRDYAKENKEQKAESDRKYRLANTDKIAEKNKAWRTKNYKHTKAKALDWRRSNKEQKAITDKAWAQNNKENVRNISMRRRARKAQNGIFTVTKKDIVALLNAGCLYCGRPAEHVDHIIPISRGGRHGIGNLTGSCATCNLSKGSKFVMEWKKGRK